MAHQTLELTTTPKAINTDLSLVADIGYLLQNLNTDNILLAEVAAVPDTTSRAISLVKPLEQIIYTVDSTNNLYGWVMNGKGYISTVES